MNSLRSGVLQHGNHNCAYSPDRLDNLYEALEAVNVDAITRYKAKTLFCRGEGKVRDLENRNI